MSNAMLSCGLVAAALPFVAAGPLIAMQDEADQTLPSEWINQLRWRDVGPANMSGRITDITVYEADSTQWWAATASGGLLKTTDNGVTFEHQFDHEATVSIGDVEVSQSNPKILYVGTGEENPRNSVSWGNGVYRSDDGGATWVHKGLDETFQIGEIQVHPENPDIVYVAALGRLWGPNEQRGIFKSTDGGDTWEKVHYIDDKTGFIDIDMHPEDPDTLLAASYERERDGFDGNDPAKKWGAGSGLWKTTDGGANWTKLTYGLPEVTMGRVGIDYSRSNPNNVYAVIETELIAQEPEDAAFFGAAGEDLEIGYRLTELVEDGPAATAGLQKGDVVLSIDGNVVGANGDLARKLRGYAAGDSIKVVYARDEATAELTVELARRPEGEQRTGRGGRGGGRGGRGGGFNLSSGLGGQVENMQDQQGPRGYNHGGIYKSTDGGETWARINSLNPRPMYYSQIRVDPTDENHIWVLGTSLYRSEDGGHTFMSNAHRGSNGATHVDHHAMWIDNTNGRHVILGNDGGVYITHDRAGSWDHLNHVAIGQFYHVSVDTQPNYNIYGGLQDNGSWGGPNMVRNDRGPINSDWFSVGGGDGFIVFADPDDPNQLYSESQNGATSRLHLVTGERASTRPSTRGPDGERLRYRFNWKTPFILSNHNSKIYYSAGNYVFRSVYKGNRNEPISPEITNTDRGAGSALSESPLDHKVIYVGTTDGAVWGTRDFGETWNEIYTDRPATADASDEAEAAGEPTDADATEAADADDAPATSPGAMPQDPQRQGGRGRRGGAQLVERLKEMDANGNGKIEKSEAPERMGQMFDRLDSNSDGVIDEKELEAAAEMAGQRGGRGGAQRGGNAGNAGDPAGNRGAAERGQDAAADEAASEDDGISGVWEAAIVADEFEAEFTMALKLGEGNVVTGTLDSEMGGGDVLNGKWDPESKTLTFDFDADGMELAYIATIDGNEMEGTVAADAAGMEFPFEGSREAPEPARPVRVAAPATEVAATEAPATPAASAAGDDGVSGTWSATIVTDQFESEFSFTLKLGEGNAVSGTIDTELGDGDISDGKYDAETSTVTFVFDTGQMALEYTGKIAGDSMAGDIAAAGAGMTFPFEAKREAPAGGGASSGGDTAAASSGGETAPLGSLVPGPRWVSSIEASRFEEGRVYLTLDGHRSNDDEPYPFVSEDYGETWRSIRSNLPTEAGSTRVLREDFENPNVLYLGCEFSTWVTVDRGESWTKLNSNLPTVSVHEIAQHVSSNEIIAGTHGRSIWICDITPIRQMSAETINADAHLYKPNDVIRWRTTPRRGNSGLRRYTGTGPDQSVEVYYNLASDTDVTLTVTDLEGNVMRTLDASGDAGFHKVVWDGRRDPQPGPQGRGGRGRGGFRGGVPTGEYKVMLTANGNTYTQKFSLLQDPTTPANGVSTEGLWEWIEAQGDDEDE